MRPMILLTAGTETVRGMAQRQLFDNYGAAIYEAGGQPVLALGMDEELADRADGLFLTGGVDIEPGRYGMERKDWCGKADLPRDQEELCLFSFFEKRKKPILGVCRGLQLINTAMGGTLWQDQKQECGAEGHIDGAVHLVSAEPDSVLGSLFGEEFLVNSYHHQSVRTLGEGLRVTARAGMIVEGFEHKSLPVWAVQWHPERMTGRGRVSREGPDMNPLFAWFVKACREGGVGV
ncbi:MAG: gamma-glutamyl-gamma-aminobutyrate hydrolase family protein [Hungatella sp.]|nr:gamma-glutamyl-gamma-aminobutyrate hydrolase family protein [Hungatella sp.]